MNFIEKKFKELVEWVMDEWKKMKLNPYFVGPYYRTDEGV